MAPYEAMACSYGACRSLQPCDTGDTVKNTSLLDAVVDYIKKHPAWRLSLQTHKLIHIP